MKSQRGRVVNDILSANGELSSNRIVFLIGSTIIFTQFIRFPESVGIQNLVMSVMGFAAASTTVSKFAKRQIQKQDGEQNNEDI